MVCLSNIQKQKAKFVNEKDTSRHLGNGTASGRFDMEKSRRSNCNDFAADTVVAHDVRQIAVRYLASTCLLCSWICSANHGISSVAMLARVFQRVCPITGRVLHWRAKVYDLPQRKQRRRGLHVVHEGYTALPWRVRDDTGRHPVRPESAPHTAPVQRPPLLGGGLLAARNARQINM